MLQKRGSGNTRNGQLKRAGSRCASVSYHNPIITVGDLGSGRRRDITSNQGSLDLKHSKGHLWKSRRSLGDSRHAFHQASQSTIQDNTQDLRDENTKGKGIVASFAGIETITFNLSSKVKMLQTTNFF